MKRLILFFAFIVIITSIKLVNAQVDLSQISPEAASSAIILRELINEKTEELKKNQEQREDLEKNMESVSQLKGSIQKEIKTIDNNISQLNLSVKANELTLDKLGMEISLLSDEIQNTEKNIANGRETVIKLLIALQQKDKENLFFSFLKGNNLSQSFSEIKSITTLNNALLSSINELKNFQIDLSQKLEIGNSKKRNREIERENLTNRQYIINDQKNEKKRILTQTKDQERIYQEQIAELDKKQEEISKIIEEFENKIRASFDPSLLPIKRHGVLGSPLDDLVITQKYGPTQFASRAYRTKTHTGVDFRASIGTPIFATQSGKIIANDNNDRGTSRWNKYQYGRYIIIEHENNLSTLYAHLSRSIVKKGDIVNKGDIIGYSGNSGYSFGPHLHLSVFWAPSVEFKSIPPVAGLVPIGITIDPLDYLPPGISLLESAK
ncbi:MAG: peptidoglycan DD-metalloendopeptidase family protein [Patescibacteria group bacterium]|nr:peptidoglycan DD-metalloendopeptidase family protein [Patescibacteria group bacterium]